MEAANQLMRICQSFHFHRRHKTKVWSCIRNAFTMSQENTKSSSRHSIFALYFSLFPLTFWPTGGRGGRRRIRGTRQIACLARSGARSFVRRIKRAATPLAGIRRVFDEGNMAPIIASIFISVHTHRESKTKFWVEYQGYCHQVIRKNSRRKASQHPMFYSYLFSLIM